MKIRKSAILFFTTFTPSVQLLVRVTTLCSQLCIKGHLLTLDKVGTPRLQLNQSFAVVVFTDPNGWDSAKCTKDAEKVYAPLLMVSIWGRKGHFTRRQFIKMNQLIPVSTHLCFRQTVPFNFYKSNFNEAYLHIFVCA